jgi:hypothetical protein
MRGILSSELPKTFQDAFTITRQLGFQYIWIDSLCILQDSKEDWEEQSAQMHDIYRNSFLTIAATSARNASHGCFVRKTMVRGANSFQVPGKSKGHVSLFVRDAAEDVHREFQYGFPFEPLSKRGWAFQERVLSPRILNFASCEISWECQKETLCYCGTDLFGNADTKRALIKATEIGPFMSLSRMAGGWRDTVELYTRRSLSFDSDTLPALAGLASSFPKIEGNDYLAGLWRFDLHQDLLWSQSKSSIYGPRSKRAYPHRSSSYCAPTWSWASLVGTVSWYDRWLPGNLDMGSDWFSQKARIIDARCEVEGKNPWGTVSFGFLSIEAPITSVKLGHYEISKPHHVDRCQVGLFSSSSSKCQTPSVNWIEGEWAALDVPAKDGGLEQGDYWCVRIAARSPPSSMVLLQDYVDRSLLGDLGFTIEKTHTIHYNLLLKRSLQYPEAYERVGLFIKTVPLGAIWNPGAKLAIIVI